MGGAAGMFLNTKDTLKRNQQVDYLHQIVNMSSSAKGASSGGGSGNLHPPIPKRAKRSNNGIGEREVGI